MRMRNFEQLSCSLLDVIWKVKDLDSLSLMTKSLLEEVCGVILLSCNTQSEGTPQRKIFHIYPEASFKGWLESPPPELWTWYDKEDLDLGLDSYIFDSEIKIGDQRFPGALVVFGDKQFGENHDRVEMVVLKKFNLKVPQSHYAFIAKNILKQFLIMDFRLRMEDAYSDFTSQKVLPDLSWRELKSKVDKILINKYKLIYTVVWLFYQCRKIIQQVNESKSDNQKENLLDEPDKFNECKEGFEKLKLPNGQLKFIKDIGVFFLRPGHNLTVQESVIKSSKKENLYKKKDNTNASKELQIILLYLYLYWWQVMRISGYDHDKIKQSKNQNDDEKDQSDKESKRRDDPKDLKGNLFFDPTLSTIELKNYVLRVLHLTHTVLLNILQETTNNKNNDPSDWGRDVLRMYFAMILSRGKSRMAELYLAGGNSLEHKCAPDRLCRSFIVSLGRFMISVMGICLKRHDFPVAPSLVSPSEELDSLLYMVDRYAHVELQVTEELNIRRLLSKQIAAEVYHHLSNPYYRDHLLHAVDVFLIGHVILNTHFSWIENEEAPLVDHLCKLSTHRKNDEFFLTQKPEWFRNWAVASLLHDIGYQIGDGNYLTSQQASWEDYFHLNTRDSLGELVLNWDDGIGNAPINSKEHGSKFLGNLYGLVMEKFQCQDMFEPNEKAVCDHGMISALRIAQVLLHADNHNVQDASRASCALLQSYQNAVHAIAMHNLQAIPIKLYTHPLSCLLRICDELQEWDRKRVNIEKVVKGLYLDIQEGVYEDLQAYDKLDTFKANFSMSINGTDSNQWQLNLKNIKQDGSSKNKIQNCSSFHFQLFYKNAVSAHFDPLITLLEKAFCFQNIDFDVDPQKQNEIRVMVEIDFPKPKEYGSLTEYDIYGLFTEEARDLALLEETVDIVSAKAGLVRIKPNDEKGVILHERFGIILQQRPEVRLGRLATNPGQFRDRYDKFKKNILLGR